MRSLSRPIIYLVLILEKLISQLPRLLHYLGRTVRKIDVDKVMDNLFCTYVLSCMHKTRLWTPIIFYYRARVVLPVKCIHLFCFCIAIADARHYTFPLRSYPSQTPYILCCIHAVSHSIYMYVSGRLLLRRICEVCCAVRQRRLGCVASLS